MTRPGPSNPPEPPLEASIASQDTTRAASELSASSAAQKRITGQAGVVAAGTLLSRILGLVRDQVIAALFNRAATDAFFIAFTIPNLLRQLLAEGAVQSAVLPVLSATREREGEAAAKNYFRALRGLSLCVLSGVTLLGMAGAPWLVDLFASGYHDQPGQYERTVTLTRWLFPYLFFIGSAALGVAALNAHKRFVVSSFAPALLNVAFVVCALALGPFFARSGHDPTLALAIGALLGGILQAVAQWPSLRRIGYLERPRLDFSNPGVRATLGRMAPVLIGIGVYYLDVIVGRRLLSELPTGSQSYFGWALRLCDFPQGIFVMALQTATLPSLSALIARGDRAEFERTFAFGMRLSLFVGIAGTALVTSLAEPLVVVIFQRGEFDAVASHETARALFAQGLGIWMVAAVRQLVSVYYALGDTRTPVTVAAIDFCAFVVFALVLRGPLGHVGVSFAVTASSAVQVCLLWVRLRGKLENRHTRAILGSCLKTLIAALAAAIASRELVNLVRSSSARVGMGRLLPGISGCLAFCCVFFAAAWLVKSPELATLGQAVQRRRRK